MKIVNYYIERNRIKINEIFKKQSKFEEITATSLHNFLRNIFKLEDIKFIKQGKDYFKGD